MNGTPCFYTGRMKGYILSGRGPFINLDVRVCIRIQIWRVLHVRMFGLSNSTLGFVLVLTRGDQQQWGSVYANEISADSTIGRCFFAKVLPGPGLLLLFTEGVLIIFL